MAAEPIRVEQRVSRPVVREPRTKRRHQRWIGGELARQCFVFRYAGGRQSGRPIAPSRLAAIRPTHRSPITVKIGTPAHRAALAVAPALYGSRIEEEVRQPLAGDMSARPVLAAKDQPRRVNPALLRFLAQVATLCSFEANSQSTLPSTLRSSCIQTAKIGSRIL